MLVEEGTALGQAGLYLHPLSLANTISQTR